MPSELIKPEGRLLHAVAWSKSCLRRVLKKRGDFQVKAGDGRGWEFLDKDFSRKKKERIGI